MLQRIREYCRKAGKRNDSCGTKIVVAEHDFKIHVDEIGLEMLQKSPYILMKTQLSVMLTADPK